jgi:hypothetical protein
VERALTAGTFESKPCRGTYDIGDVGHTHTVTLTAAHFAQLVKNETFTVTSTSAEAHSHQVTVACA